MYVGSFHRNHFSEFVKASVLPFLAGFGGGLKFGSLTKNNTYFILYNDQNVAIIYYCRLFGSKKVSRNWILTREPSVDKTNVQLLLWKLKQRGIKLELEHFRHQTCVTNQDNQQQRSQIYSQIGMKMLNLMPKVDTNMHNLRFMACLINSYSFRKVLDCINLEKKLPQRND